MLIILKKIMSWNYVPFGKRCREQVCSIFLEKNKDAPYLANIVVAFLLFPCSLFLHNKVTQMWS